MKSTWRSAAALHPYLFGTWFVLEYARRIPQSVTVAGLALIILLGIIALVHLFLRRVIHDGPRAALATTVLLFPILYFQPGQYLLQELAPPLASFRYSVPAFLLVTGGALWILLRRKPGVQFVQNILATVLALFVALQLVMIGGSQKEHLSSGHMVEQRVVDPDPPQGDEERSEQPDIYYIILDSYTSAGSLSRYWHFDNTEFLSNLRQRGFYIASASRSHYTSTAQSLATSLNMDTLAQGDNPFDRIRSNLVTAYLRSRGYAIYNLSLFDEDCAPRFYSFFSNEEGTGAGLEYFFNNTGVGVLLAAYHAQDMPYENLRVLSTLRRVAADSTRGPKFIYAHLLTPHGPYALDRDGKVIPLLARKGWKDASAYLDQLAGTNRLLLPVIDQIIGHTPRVPVIIIQGDHGSRLVPGLEGLLEAHTILNAYLLPGDGARLLYPSISPVNSFRVVLQACFGLPLELTADYPG